MGVLLGGPGDVSERSGAFWASFRAPGMRLGCLLRPSWRVLEALRGQLEASWTLLGVSWRRFGPLLGRLGWPWEGLGCVSEASGEVFGTS